MLLRVKYSSKSKSITEVNAQLNQLFPDIGGHIPSVALVVIAELIVNSKV